jgi:hypothetical protein
VLRRPVEIAAISSQSYCKKNPTQSRVLQGHYLALYGE